MYSLHMVNMLLGRVLDRTMETTCYQEIPAESFKRISSSINLDLLESGDMTGLKIQNLKRPI